MLTVHNQSQTLGFALPELKRGPFVHVLWPSGDTQVLPRDEFSSVPYVASNSMHEKFQVRGFSYGDVVQTKDSVGIICGWTAEKDTLLVFVPVGKSDDHDFTWEEKKYAPDQVENLVENTKITTARVEGTPFTYAVEFVQTHSPADIKRMAERARRRHIKTKWVDVLKPPPSSDEVAEAERKMRFQQAATVIHYQDRVREGEGRDYTNFYKIVPQVEAFPAALHILADYCGSTDLDLLRRIKDRLLAEHLTYLIRCEVEKQDITIENVRPTQNTDGWMRVGNMVRYYRQRMEDGDGISTEDLAKEADLPAALVALVDAQLVQHLSVIEFTKLTNALELRMYDHLGKDHG